MQDITVLQLQMELEWEKSVTSVKCNNPLEVQKKMLVQMLSTCEQIKDTVKFPKFTQSN